MLKLVPWEKILVSLPIVEGVIATIVFVIKGGTAGGHQVSDFVIAWLVFPSLGLIPHLPLPEIVYKLEYVVIVLIPVVLNSILMFLVVVSVRVIWRVWMMVSGRRNAGSLR